MEWRPGNALWADSMEDLTVVFMVQVPGLQRAMRCRPLINSLVYRTLAE